MKEMYEIIIHRTYGTGYYRIMAENLYNAITRAHEMCQKNEKISVLDEIIEIRGYKIR